MRRTIAGDDLAAIGGALQETHFGFAVFDARGHLVAANARLKRMFESAHRTLVQGESLSDILSALAKSKEVVIDSDPARWSRELVEALLGTESRELMLADGRVLDLLPTQDAQGQLVLSVQDITRLKRGERALQTAKDLAERANLTKSRFLRAANHDLRQPLATLKILIYTCMTAVDDEARRDMLHAMDVSVEVMEDLIRSLLHIGQLDAGNIIPRKAAFPISSLFDRLRIQFTPLAREKGLDFQVGPCSDSILTDRSLMERVLSNLIANAITYTKIGSVTVTCIRRGSICTIEVRDTGPGIAQDQHERIFEEFYRIDNSDNGQRKRLGLGLNIAKRISEIAGHRIVLQSEVGCGSVFSVDVPVGDVWRSEVIDREISETLAGQFAGVPVLLIEDDMNLRQVLTALLQRWGIVVSACSRWSDVEEVLAVAQSIPRLVISDFRLRGDELGTDICLRLRSILGPDLPCIIITADSEPESHATLQQLGLPVMTKPVSPPRLRVLMHRLLYEVRDGAPIDPAPDTGRT